MSRSGFWSRKRWGVLALVCIAFSTTAYFVKREVRFADNQKLLDAATAETDRSDPSWRWDDLQAARDAVPDGQNALLQIRRVKALLGEVPPGEREAADDSTFSADVIGFAPPNRLLPDDKRAQLRQFLDRYAGAVHAARDIGKFSKGRFLYQRALNPLDTRLDEVQDWRNIFQLLALDSEQRLLEADIAGALDDVRILLTNIHFFADEPSLIAQLVRMAGTTVAVGCLERALAMGEPGKELAALDEPIARLAVDRDMYHALRGERANFADLFDKLDRQVLFLSRIGDHAGGRAGLWERVGWFDYRASFPSDRAFFLRLMNRLIGQTNLPLHEQRPAYDGLRGELMAHPEHVLTRRLLPAVDRVAMAAQRKQAQVECGRVAVALERFRQRNGRWPGSLDELRRDLLQVIPVDPFSGEPVRYRRTDDGLVVYTVGENQKDDGGDVIPNIGGRAGPLDVGFRLWDPDKRRRPQP